VSLLAEHGGLGGIRAVRSLSRIGDLVERLDGFAMRPGARLQRHGPPTPIQDAAMEVLDPATLPGDPDTSPERESDEPVDESHPSLLAPVTDTITALRNYLQRQTGRLGTR
jgi:hypothetical protein